MSAKKVTINFDSSDDDSLPSSSGVIKSRRVKKENVDLSVDDNQHPSSNLMRGQMNTVTPDSVADASSVRGHMLVPNNLTISLVEEGRNQSRNSHDHVIDLTVAGRLDDITATSSITSSGSHETLKTFTRSQILLILNARGKGDKGKSSTFGNGVIFRNFELLRNNCYQNVPLYDSIASCLRVLQGIQFKYRCLNLIGLSDICLSYVEDEETAGKIAWALYELIHHKNAFKKRHLVVELAKQLKGNDDGFNCESLNANVCIPKHVENGNLILSQWVMMMATGFKAARKEAIRKVKRTQDVYQSTYYHTLVDAAIKIRKCTVPVQWLTLSGMVSFDIIGSITSVTGNRILKAFELKGEVNWTLKNEESCVVIPTFEEV